MDLKNKKNKNFVVWLAVLIAVCILIFLGVRNIDTIGSALSWFIGLSLPLVAGIALAAIINVPMRFLERHFWKKSTKKLPRLLRRPIAFSISLIFILGILVGVVWIIIPEVLEAATIIVKGLTDMFNRLSNLTEADFESIPFGAYLAKIDWNQMLVALQTWFKDQGGNILKGAFGTLSSLLTGIFDTIVAFVFAAYILFSKEKLKAQGRRIVEVWLPKNSGKWLIHAADVTSANFRNFISGQTLEALILGTLCFIGMLIFRFPYAPMISILVGITALVPVIGGLVGGAIGAFMILTVDAPKVIPFIIYLIILQQLEGNLIYPRVMGKKVKLPGLWIIAAITIGGGIGGPIGMLLSVPIVSTIYTLFKEATRTRELRIEGELESTEPKDGSEISE